MTELPGDSHHWATDRHHIIKHAQYGSARVQSPSVNDHPAMVGQVPECKVTPTGIGTRLGARIVPYS